MGEGFEVLIWLAVMGFIGIRSSIFIPRVKSKNIQPFFTALVSFLSNARRWLAEYFDIETIRTDISSAK